jgi:hypothetical protein
LTKAGYLLAICHPTVTLNVAKTTELGGYRFNLHIEDIDLWWRMALKHEIRLIPEETVGFRLQIGNQFVPTSKFTLQIITHASILNLYHPCQ